MRFRVYQDGRFASGAVAAGRTLTVYEDGAMVTQATLYAAATGATTVTNPYTVPATGIIDFWVEDSEPWGLAQGDSTARPLRILRGAYGADVVSVTDYGAKGDGTTDDSTAIQAAITAGAGGRVLVPEGTYLVSTTLSLSGSDYDGTTIVGSGRGRSVLKLASAADTHLLELTTCDDCALRDLTLDGNRSAQSTPHTYAIDVPLRIFGTERLSVESVEITNSAGVGVWLSWKSTTEAQPLNTAFLNCYIHDTGHANILAWHADGLRIHDCVFEDWARTTTDFAVYGTSNYLDDDVKTTLDVETISASLYARGLTCTTHSEYVELYSQTDMSGYTRCVVHRGQAGTTAVAHNTSCVWQYAGSAAALTFGGVADDPLSDSLRFDIQHNLFRNANADRFAIEASNYVQDSVISNNVFDGNQYNAEGISGAFWNVVFAGNTHSNGMGSHRSGYELVGSHLVVSGNNIRNGGILTSTVDQVAIVGNYVRSAKVNARAIGIGNSGTSDQVLVADNVLDIADGTSSVDAVYIGPGVVTDVRVSGNLIKGGNVADRQGVRINPATGSSGIEIIGNRIYDHARGIRFTSDDYSDEVTVAFNDLRDCTVGLSNATGPTGGTYRIYGNTLAANQLGVTLNAAGNTVQYAAAAPVAGTYLQGDIVFNTAPAAEGYVGWVCVTAGTPGTWRGFGLIEADPA